MPIDRPPRFEQFFEHLKKVDSIDASIPDWLFPAWLKHLNSMEEPVEEPAIELNDSELEKHLNELRNPVIEVDKKYEDVVPKIQNYLKAMAKKIAASINHARKAVVNSEDLADWYDGLKGFAMRLAKNARAFPAWLDSISQEPAITAESCSLIGLLGPEQSGSLCVGFPDSTQITYLGVMPKPLEKRHQLQYAENLAWMLVRGNQVIPEEGGGKRIRQAINLLSGIWQSSQLKGKELSSFVTMIPVGYRFAVCTVSEDNYAVILDMIKSEDGYVYGIKYATSDATHASTLAFCLPIQLLPNLLEFLNGPYNLYNDIGAVCHVWAKVNLPWYPRAKISNPLAMVRHYAMSWPIGDRLRIGVIFEYSDLLLLLKTGHIHPKAVEDKDFLMDLIDQTSEADAKKLLKMIKELHQPITPEGDEVAIKAKALFHAIIRRLNARID